MKRERIVVTHGPGQGEEFELIGSLSIGRSPENRLQLNDLQVSRKHAVIQQTPNGTIIRDLGSGNGTYVDNRRILEYRLTPQDIIRIGPAELRYEVAEKDVEPRGRDTAIRFQHDEVRSGALHAQAAENLHKTLFEAPRESEDTLPIRRMQKRLAAIYEANQIISSERDLKRLFARVMEQVLSLVPAHNGVILLKDDRTGEIVTEYVHSGEGGPVVVSTTIVSRALERAEAVLTHNAANDDRFESGASIIAQNIASAMCVPLMHQHETLGVIYVDTRGARNAFADSDLQLLSALAAPASIAIKNAQYVARVERAYQDTLVVLANAIELRDHYTVGHTWRVTNFAAEMARTLGWDEERLRVCQMGGVLHDIGKIAVPDAVLRKPGGLAEDEFAQMKVHPERGARLMQDVESLAPLIPYALYHHERYDGNGYPFGLAGENIPLEGRLLAVADTFDAMTSNRPYRKGLDPEIALAELERGKNTQFDPACVDALLTAYREGRIDRILQEYFKKEEKSIACPFCSTYLPTPSGAKVGDAFSCSVCHRRIRLCFRNDAYFGELLTVNDRDASFSPNPEE